MPTRGDLLLGALAAAATPRPATMETATSIRPSPASRGGSSRCT